MRMLESVTNVRFCTRGLSCLLSCVKYSWHRRQSNIDGWVPSTSQFCYNMTYYFDVFRAIVITLCRGGYGRESRLGLCLRELVNRLTVDWRDTLNVIFNIYVPCEISCQMCRVNIADIAAKETGDWKCGRECGAEFHPLSVFSFPHFISIHVNVFPRLSLSSFVYLYHACNLITIYTGCQFCVSS